MKNRWKQFWKDESGIGVVEIILILVVLIMLVVFREQITAIVTNAFQQINSGASKINTGISIKKK